MPSFDLSDLEAVFAVSSANAAEPKSKLAPAQKAVTTVIGANRAQNVAIMLSRFRMSYQAIRHAVLAVDNSRLSVDNLMALRQYTPTSEEVSLHSAIKTDRCAEHLPQMENLRSYNGPVTSLTPGDQYFAEVSRHKNLRCLISHSFLQIMNVPRLSVRLDCMLYSRKLELEMEELKPELLILRSAADELRQSAQLKILLAVSSLCAAADSANSSLLAGCACARQQAQR